MPFRLRLLQQGAVHCLIYSNKYLKSKNRLSPMNKHTVLVFCILHQFSN